MTVERIIARDTPTNDDRKAIAQVILPVFDQLASAVYGDGPYSEAESALEAADLLSAAGFRRSEVQGEPSDADPRVYELAARVSQLEVENAALRAAGGVR